MKSNLLQNINQKLDRIKSSEFASQISILASGNIIAQSLVILSSPILTRLYEPADFARFTIFTTFATTLIPVISGRYNIALLVVDDNKESNKLTSLAIILTTLNSLILFLALFFFLENLVNILNISAIKELLLLSPVLMFSTGILIVLNNYLNRFKNYKLLSNALILQALTTTILSIALGLTGTISNGLIIGSLFGPIISVFYILLRKKMMRFNLSFLVRFNLVNLALKYRNFPLYSLPQSTLGSITASLPIFFLTKYYPESIVGYYALSTKITTAGLGVLSKAISQVHIRKVAEQIHSKQDPSQYIIKLTIVLGLIVTFPTLLVIFKAKYLIVNIFGEKWEIAADILVILIPSIVVQFIVSTLSGIFSSTGQLRLAVIWQATAFLSTLLMFIYCSPRLSSYELFEAMVITDVILYLAYYCLIYYAIKNPLPIQR